ncbi:MAG: hypothetical protein LKE40_00425 [Spirochaetia bacterium]|nr:hypothetical protein [Spirochaetia bacterium]
MYHKTSWQSVIIVSLPDSAPHKMSSGKLSFLHIIDSVAGHTERYFGGEGNGKTDHGIGTADQDRVCRYRRYRRT